MKYSKIQYKLKSFIKHTFDKDLFNCRKELISSAKDYNPWDYSFMLKVLINMAKLNEVFCCKYYGYNNRLRMIRDMKLIQQLSYILLNENKTFKIKIINTDYGTKYQKVALINVNTRNYKRFNPTVKEEFFKENPEDLYLMKVGNLLGKIISYNLRTWWI